MYWLQLFDYPFLFIVVPNGSALENFERHKKVWEHHNNIIKIL